jgi:hypothetical protein
VDDLDEAGKHGVAAPVGDGEHGAVTDVLGNGVKKRYFLDVEKSAQRVMSRWCLRTGGGSATAVKVGTRGAAGRCVVVPLSKGTSFL